MFIYFRAVKNLASSFNTTKTRLVKSRETTQQTNKDLKRQAEGEGSCFFMMGFITEKWEGVKKIETTAAVEKKPKKEE